MTENFEDNFSIPQDFCSSNNPQILEFIVATYRCETCKNIPRFPLKKELKSSIYYCSNCIGDTKQIVYPAKAELGLFEHIVVNCYNRGCQMKYPYKNLKELYEHSMVCPEIKNNSLPSILSSNLLKKIDSIIKKNQELSDQVLILGDKNKDLEAKILKVQNELKEKFDNDLRGLRKELTGLKGKYSDLQEKFHSKASEIKKKMKKKFKDMDSRINDILLKKISHNHNLSPNLNNFMTNINTNHIDTKFFDSTPPTKERSSNKNDKEIIVKEFVNYNNNLSLVEIDNVISFLPIVMEHEIFRGLNIKKALLLYKGSENEFSAKTFHQKCDNKGPTITIVRSDKGNIFGGYTPISWDSSNSWGKDEKKEGFLFSITRSTKHKILRSEHAIDNCAVFGPTFGNGADLYISDECHMNESSYSELGETYETQYKFQSVEARSLLSGSIKYFKVDEYEVYVIY